MKKLFTYPVIALSLITLLSFPGCKGKNNQSPLTALIPIALLGGGSSPSSSSTTTSTTTETAPSGLVFTTGSTGTNTATLTVGISVSITPTVTGTITNCTVNPALPAGLSLNPTTCAITGIPSAAFAQTTFTITASNQYGSTTSTITLTGTANPPANLAFPSGGTATFTTGVSSSLVPTFTGGITNCTISPALPTGIVINPSTCAISGTPTAVSPQTNYTITATNQFGNTTANLNFGINTLAPQALSYSFGGSTLINSNTTVNYALTVTGGVSSCNVNPTLPAGLVLNPTTCAITGTPTATTASTSYTITATNQYGSGTVTVNIGTTLVAPTAFSFPYVPGATTTYTIGTPVSVSPSFTGVVTNCSASPTLPAGLSLNTSTCAITGIPTTESGVTTYTITASNGSGNTTTTIKVKVDNVPPSNLAYPFGSSTILAVGTAVSISPTFIGGITSCSPSPALPTGLSLSATTCTISGTPSAAKVATAYTITAANAYGNTNVIVTITAQLFAPSSISFPFAGGTVNYTTGVAVNVSPTLSGIVTSCSVSPSLPTGLTLNTTTCAITGTPTGTSPARNYTITASNASGSANTTVTIGVNPPAPSNLVYPANGVLFYIVAVSKTVTPTSTGTIVTCTSSPSLPAGLTLNNTTCAISGTTTVEQTNIAYVITASNGGGSTTANITLTVAQISAPTLSLPSGHYNTPQTVNFSTSSGGEIRCTLDETEPTPSSEVYSGGVHIYSLTGTLKCKTFIDGVGSQTVTRNYTYPPIATGQTTVYQAGDNGTYQSGVARSYTDNGDGTITNNYSGQTWLKCGMGSNDDCSETVSYSYPVATNKCNALTLGGKTWRLPTLIELNDLVESSKSTGLGVDTAFFPDLMGYNLWTSTSYGLFSFVFGEGETLLPGPYDPNFVFSLQFSNDFVGGPGTTRKSWAIPGQNGGDSWIVRCVSGQSSPKQSFIDNQDGTVKDKKTNLVWQKCGAGQNNDATCSGAPSYLNWEGAINYCNGLNLAGRTWRLPTQSELIGLVDYSITESFPRIDSTFFPRTIPIMLTSYFGSYWTSTTQASKTPNAMCVGFVNGATGGGPKTFASGDGVGVTARCVSGP
jgi:hypothetical protein